MRFHERRHARSGDTADGNGQSTRERPRTSDRKAHELVGERCQVAAGRGAKESIAGALGSPAMKDERAIRAQQMSAMGVFPSS